MLHGGIFFSVLLTSLRESIAITSVYVIWLALLVTTIRVLNTFQWHQRSHSVESGGVLDDFRHTGNESAFNAGRRD
jgi:hypothetical protein